MWTKERYDGQRVFGGTRPEPAGPAAAPQADFSRLLASFHTLQRVDNPLIAMPLLLHGSVLSLVPHQSNPSNRRLSSFREAGHKNRFTKPLHVQTEVAELSKVDIRADSPRPQDFREMLRHC
jgi:hypothetical protein